MKWILIRVGKAPLYLTIKFQYLTFNNAKNNELTKMVECEDVNCPFHGELATRGIILEGVVASDKMDKTVVVQRDRYVKSRKYERYMSKRSRILAHNPPCINARKGDKVRIAECRKLSKNKSFVVIKKLEEEGKEKNKSS